MHLIAVYICTYAWVHDCSSCLPEVDRKVLWQGLPTAQQSGSTPCNKCHALLLQASHLCFHHSVASSPLVTIHVLLQWLFPLWFYHNLNCLSIIIHNLDLLWVGSINNLIHWESWNDSWMLSNIKSLQNLICVIPSLFSFLFFFNRVIQLQHI